MEDENKEYFMHCPVCETDASMIAINTEERPEFCPMCGTEIGFEEGWLE